MKKLKIAIIGCGSITEKRHAPEYVDNPHVELVGFYDLNKVRSELMVEKFGGKVFNTYQEILDNPEIDAISDCTPNFMHIEICINALKKGKHVLCEKPMAISLDEATQIMRWEKESQKVFFIDHNQRFNQAHIEVKNIIKSGNYGKILSFRTVFGHGGPENWSESKSKNTWFFKKSQSKYGVIGDLGVHKLDLIRYLTGLEFVEVSAMGGILHKTFENGDPIEVYDNTVVLMKLSNSALGTGAFSWTYYGKEDNSTVIYLENAEIRIYDDEKYQIKIIEKSGHKIDYQVEKMQTNDSQTKTGVIDSFIDCIMTNRQSPVNAYDGYKSIEIINAIVKAILEKRTITL